jgi:galactokinase
MPRVKPTTGNQNERGAQVFEARAPGMLDVMGGVSAHDGGTCLAWPLRCEAVARVSLSQNSTLEASWSRDKNEPLTVATSEWLALDFARARKYLQEQNFIWAASTLGALLVLRDEGRLPQGNFGLRFQLQSDVPCDAGLFFRASAEVAAVRALNQALGLGLGDDGVARLCRRTHREMGDLTQSSAEHAMVAHCRTERLLRVKCQPDLVQGHIALPGGLELWGIHSGTKQSRARSTFEKARMGAAMGQQALRSKVANLMRGPDGQQYLANIGPDIWRALRQTVPEAMAGREFIERFGAPEATEVEAGETYSVRLPTEHPVYEADRVQRFAALLEAVEENEGARNEILRAVGELMVQSHFSYDHRWGLASPETDLLVRLAREAGPSQGVYGARVLGRGGGGTVVVLADSRKNPRVGEVLASLASRYAQQTGLAPHLFGDAGAL